MARTPARARRSLALLLLAAGAGCAGGKSWSYNEQVEGTVTFDGTPLANAVVQFVPDVDSTYQAPVSSGQTDAAGHFTLTCEGKKPGAVLGKHNVLVYQGRDAGRGNDEGAGEAGPVRRAARVPAAYTTPLQTPLKVEVTPDQHTYDLAVSSRGGR
jgi:hypothetical protein